MGSLALLQRAIRRQFGPVTAAAFMLLTALQFHLPFYLSRTLPNVLAMPLTSAGLAAWLDGGAVAPIWLLAAAAVSRRAGVPAWLWSAAVWTAWWSGTAEQQLQTFLLTNCAQSCTSLTAPPPLAPSFTR